MVDLSNRAQVLTLLAECKQHLDKFTPTELEMYSHLKKKYATSTDGSFDDKTCLEIMLRNIGIRQSFNMDKSEATRVIDLKSSSDLDD